MGPIQTYSGVGIAPEVRNSPRSDEAWDWEGGKRRRRVGVGGSGRGHDLGYHLLCGLRSISETQGKAEAMSSGAAVS